jgi:hypothetical protein
VSETPTTFSMTDLYGKRADESLVREANAFRTLRTGLYQITTEKIDNRIGSEKSPWPGAYLFNIQVAAVPVGEGADDRKGGKQFHEISFESLRRDTGELATPSKLAGQYMKALGVEGKEIPEVMEAVALYPVNAYITESFKTPEGYRTPKTEEERAAYVKSGYEPKNFTQRISAIKG